MKTLYRKFILATLVILLISTTLAFILANLVYMTSTKQIIDQENVKIAKVIASNLEGSHEHHSSITSYLESMGNLGYQIYLLNESGEGEFFGQSFSKTDLPQEAMKVIEDKEIYHGMNDASQQLLMMGHFSNDVKNTVGVPFTINEQSYALFMRPNNKLIFSDIHMILACFLSPSLWLVSAGSSGLQNASFTPSPN